MMRQVLPPPIGFGKVLGVVMLFLYIALQPLMAAATSYITFDDGHLFVFPDSCVESVTIADDCITIVALDGKVYSYPMSGIGSVDTQLTKELSSIKSYKFNNKCNYQVFTDAIGVIVDGDISLTVAGIGKRLTASFELTDDKAVVYVDGQVQTSKVSRLRFDTTRVYTVAFPGDLVLKALGDGRYALKPFGKEYNVNVTFLSDQATRVPRIDINTVGGVAISSKEYYLDAEIIIDGAGVFPSMTDSVQVKGRGNSSWSSDPSAKNPYRLKFASKVKPFGMTKGKNWVLLANKLEGSMLTNAYGMKAASLIGTVATNHMIPVDLYVNGKYKGSYNFTEKVGLAGNSVDLDDETAAALLELDTYYDEVTGQKFKSTPYNIPVNIKSPEFGEDSTLLTLALIEQRFNNFVSTVNNNGEIANHVDIENITRYLMFSEYIRNIELFHPKSTYLYHENILEDSCKFVFGPVWDLDWTCGYNGVSGSTFFNNGIRTNYYTATTSMNQNKFFTALRSNSKVAQRLFELWKDFMSNDLDELCEFCYDYYQYAAPSLTKNSTVAIDGIDYSTQSVDAAEWFRQRANFIYDTLRHEFIMRGDLNEDGVITIADVTLLIDYLLSSEIIHVDGWIADVDGDGEVTVADLTTIIDILLGIAH